MAMTRALTDITSSIVAAYVSHNSLAADAIAPLVGEVHDALVRLTSDAPVAVAEKPKPAVNPKRSVFPDFIICLEDGKKFKSMKRHLSGFGLTPEQYREKWDLPADYPMVAPAYAAARSELAKRSGLGRKPAPVAPAAPAKRKSPARPKA